MLFKNRIDAGRKLADKIGKSGAKLTDPLVLGIPRGGIGVGYPVADYLKCPLEPITVRKLPIPSNDQTGFGVVNLDKEVILNDYFLDQGYVNREEIDGIVNEVYREVLRRDRIYRGKRPFPGLEKRTVVITDDGLATGYTMLGAVRFARKRGAGEIIAATPVAHRDSLSVISEEVDKVISVQVSSALPFAVAAFYEEFYDLTDAQVVETLQDARLIKK
ncbi:MAG: phosphoribosyltransferase [Elusimicrobia bacterium]|nr:phosphoribosyltransferase [Candidatus Liberimonas magnetica]